MSRDQHSATLEGLILKVPYQADVNPANISTKEYTISFLLDRQGSTSLYTLKYLHDGNICDPGWDLDPTVSITKERAMNYLFAVASRLESHIHERVVTPVYSPRFRNENRVIRNKFLEWLCTQGFSVETPPPT